MAAAIWWPSMHLFWRPPLLESGALDPMAVPMARHLEDLWRDIAAELGDGDIQPMRQVNPEWDFMGRTFFILGEANLALRLPERKDVCLGAIDALLKDTLAMEDRYGVTHYLMSYHSARPWVEQPPRSVFVDGEIALCLGARRLVEEDDQWKRLFKERVEHIVDRMKRGPAFCAESYPDECWLFCNSAAMAALRMSEVLVGADYRELIASWLSILKERLIDGRTGILISTL